MHHRAILEHQVGELELGNEYLERLVDTVNLAPNRPNLEYAIVAKTIGTVACITGEISHSDFAQHAAKLVLDSDMVHPLFGNHANTGLALVAIARADGTAARVQYQALKPLSGTLTPFDMISVDRVLGLLSESLDDLQQAVTHFEDALAFCRKSGWQPELAWTAYDYARVLNLRPHAGASTKAAELIDEAQSLADALCMRPLAEKIIALRRNLSPSPSRPSSDPNGLTHREVEVLCLIASGQSNAEIASALVLSIRTVERHVSNIYGKTGSHSRAEATAFAYTHSLMPTT